MRFVICGISLVLMSSVLLGCGQSGNLQLVNNQDYDKRAKYLLHSNNDNKIVQTDQKVQKQEVAPDQSTPVSQVTSN